MKSFESLGCAGGWSHAFLLVGSLAAAVAGCRGVTPQTQISTARPRFESALVSYRVEYHVPSAGSSHALPVPKSDNKPRTLLLQIQYPHPDGHVGFARVELVIGSPAAAPDKSLAAQLRRALNENSPGIAYAEGIDEAWAMDIPAAELDGLLQQLEAADYFSPGAVGEPHVILAAKIDGNDFQRTWHRWPELDGLCARARKEGKLASHLQPLEPPPVLASAPATVPPLWRPASTEVAAPGSVTALEITRLPPVVPAGHNSVIR